MNNAATESIKRPTLDIAVATHGNDGLTKVAAMLLPSEEGVRYVVSWQQPSTSEQSIAGREDVVVAVDDGIGLSRNRNNSLRRCTADIVLIADNDLQYRPGAFGKIRDAFASRPEMDVAVFRCTFDSRPMQSPERETDLKVWPKNFHAVSIVIAFRRRAIDPVEAFDTRFGLGAERYRSGEDPLFILTARKRGLNCRFIPEIIVDHKGESTGSKPIADNGVLLAEGVLMAWTYPLSWPLRMPLKAWRLRRRRQSIFGCSLRWMLRGAIESYKLKKPWQ